MNIRARRTAAAALTLALAAGLASCSLSLPLGDAVTEGSTGETAEAAAVDASLPAAAPDLAGTTQLLGDVELTEIDAGAESGVHAPGLAVQITHAGVVPTISAAVYEDLTGDALDADEDGETPAEVRAADGYALLVSRYETMDPEWEPRGSAPRTDVVVKSPGADGMQLLSTSNNDAHSMGTIVMSVPEDHSPEDALIEIETADARQSVSLVDGIRIDSDVPHAYPGPREVTLTNAEKLDATFEHWISGPATVQGQVTGAIATPYLDAGRGQGDGWAAPEQMYLAIDVDWHLSESATYDETSIRLEGPDEQVFQPINDPKGLTDVFERAAVFQIPMDVATATVVIESAYRNGVLSGAKLIEFDPIRTELELG